jgi:hypothetical protein
MRIVLLFTALFAATARAEPGQWAVFDHDLNRQVRTLSADEVIEAVESGEVALLRQQAGPGPSREGKPLVLITRDGEIFLGHLVFFNEETITFLSSGIGGRVSVPLPLVAEIRSATDPIDALPSTDLPASDRIEFVNGDRVSGFITDFEDGKLLVDADDGAALELEIDTIRHIRFADTGLEPEAREAVATVHLHPMTQFLTNRIDLVLEDHLRFAWRGRETTPFPGNVVAIEPITDRVAWLAEWRPESIEHVPYLSATSEPRWHRLLQPLGTKTPGRSISMSSRTRVAFDLPPGRWNRFRSVIAIDEAAGPLPLADAAARVLADDDVLWERESLTVADGEVAIAIDLPPQATTLTLVVDYGNGLDVQDRVIWQRPALLADRDAVD